MSQITKKILATRSAKLNTSMTNLIPARGDIEIVQKSDYARHGFISFYGVDTTYLPDTVSVFIHTVDYETFDAGVYRMLGNWTEDMAQESLPQQQDYLDRITGKEWIEMPNVPKSYLNYGFRFVPVYNVYSSTMHSIGVEGCEPYVTYDTFKPDVTDFTVSGTMDNVTCTWTQADCKSWKIEFILNGFVEYSCTGVNANTNIVNQLSKNGTYTVRLTCYYDGETTVLENTINLTQTLPIITSLEPNGVLKNRENEITVTFAGQNVSEWSYEAVQNGVTKFTDSGTTIRESVIPKNLFNNGTVTIKHNAKFNNVKYTSQVNTESTFTVFGKPQQPIFNVQEVYNTTKPEYSWIDTLGEQVAYRIIIEKNGIVIEDSNEQYSASIRSYETKTALLNNSIYTVKIAIKNQYDLWCDYVLKTFRTEYSELEKPKLTIYSDDENASIILVIESAPNTSFVKNIVYRREKNKEQWVKIKDNVTANQQIVDCECGSNVEYEYKVSSVSDIGNYTDSDIKSCICNFHNTHISIANSTDKVILNMDVSTTINKNDDISFDMYDGYDKPDSSSSGINYTTLNINAEVETDIYNKLLQYWQLPLLCLRDRSGLLLYGRITQPQATYESYGLYKIQFNFTECCNEGVELDGFDEYRYCYFIERSW